MCWLLHSLKESFIIHLAAPEDVHFWDKHCNANIVICQEFEEDQEEEWKKFVPAQSYTQADELNDLKSLQRKLQETLVLLVKKQNNLGMWAAPQGEVINTSKTLKQVCWSYIDTYTQPKILVPTCPISIFLITRVGSSVSCSRNAFDFLCLLRVLIQADHTSEISTKSSDIRICSVAEFVCSYSCLFLAGSCFWNRDDKQLNLGKWQGLSAQAHLEE